MSESGNSSFEPVGTKTMVFNEREITLIYNALRDAVLKLEDTAQENRAGGNGLAADVTLELAAEYQQVTKKLL